MNKDIQHSIFNIPYSAKRGFTLVELLVTIGIFIFMTSVVLAKYRSFSTNSDFSNVVEGLVLSLREAQVYGVGSKTAGGISCGSPASPFNCAYGIYLSKASGSNGSYTVFVDVDKDGLYTASDMVVQTVSLGNTSDILISDITINGINTDTLAVTFKRPNPDAIINGDINNTSASITIKKGTTGTNSNTVNITSSGQISVQ